MAGKKSAKSGNLKAVPVLDENTVETESQVLKALEAVQEVLSDEIVEEPEAVPAKETFVDLEGTSKTVPRKKRFRITCRNNVSEMIGGVNFAAGVGYTEDSYSASWFANKDGYKVDREG